MRYSVGHKGGTKTPDLRGFARLVGGNGEEKSLNFDISPFEDQGR